MAKTFPSDITPGHLLTNFIDTLKRTSGISRRDFKALRSRIDMAATRGVKFIAPDAPEIDKSKPMEMEDFRPPYPVTVWEGELFDHGGVGLIVIARDAGNSVELNFVTTTSEAMRAFTDQNGIDGVGQWIISPLTCRIPYSGHFTTLADAAKMEVLMPDRMGRAEVENSFETYWPYVYFYTAVCQILTNHNVTTEDIEPDAKAARSRRIRGKAPLFTYKTLVIGAPKKRQVVRGGGTHASPRSHLRRGFYRTSPNGVRHWVKATMVMGETPGFVHKDYQIEGGLK